MGVFLTVRFKVQADRWFKNGDHPDDDCHMVTPDASPRSITQFEPFLSEGKVVRRFRHPGFDDNYTCPHCGAAMFIHGWIDSGGAGQVVCPGDWIIKKNNKYYPIKHELLKELANI